MLKCADGYYNDVLKFLLRRSVLLRENVGLGRVIFISIPPNMTFLLKVRARPEVSHSYGLCDYHRHRQDMNCCFGYSTGSKHYCPFCERWSKINLGYLFLLEAMHSYKVDI